ncbi:MAG: hypothetical protein COA58_03915 [Bacteroidetes bacterium]|nr:MAG: hypothetical protein COA58_03915 [Bacteroidota bacterium]
MTKLFAISLFVLLTYTSYSQNHTTALDHYAITKNHIIEYSQMSIKEVGKSVKPQDFDFLQKDEDDCSLFFSYGMKSQWDVVLTACPEDIGYFGFTFIKEDDEERELEPLKNMISNFKKEMLPFQIEDLESIELQYQFNQGRLTYVVTLNESTECIDDFAYCYNPDITVKWYGEDLEVIAPILTSDMDSSFIGEWKFKDVYNKEELDEKSLKMVQMMFADMKVDLGRDNICKLRMMGSEEEGTWSVSNAENMTIEITSEKSGAFELETIEKEDDLWIVKMGKSSFILEK